MAGSRKSLVWRPRHYAEVVVVIGRRRGARGVVVDKYSKWGLAKVRVNDDSPRFAGHLIEVPSWRLRPDRRAKRKARNRVEDSTVWTSTDSPTVPR